MCGGFIWLGAFFSLALPCSMWDPSSPARVPASASCSRSAESEPLDYQGSPQKFVFLIKRYTIFSTDSTIDDMCQESIKYKMMTSHFKSSCTTGFYQPEQHSFSCRGEEHLLTLPSKVRWLLFWLVAGERWGKVYLLHILFRYSTNKIHETWKIHERVTVAQLCPILCNPMNCSLEFSRQEYWNE